MKSKPITAVTLSTAGSRWMMSPSCATVVDVRFCEAPRVLHDREDRALVLLRQEALRRVLEDHAGEEEDAGQHGEAQDRDPDQAADDPGVAGRHRSMPVSIQPTGPRGRPWPRVSRTEQRAGDKERALMAEITIATETATAN